MNPVPEVLLSIRQTSGWLRERARIQIGTRCDRCDGRSFMVAAWKEHQWGRAAYDRELEGARKRVAEAKDAGVDVPLTYSGPYPSLAARRAITYSKGALFLDALRHDLGEAIFWRGLLEFTRVHAGGTVDSRDFQRAFERVSGRRLSRLFDDWVFGPA